MDSVEYKRNMSGLQVAGAQLPPLPQPASEKQPSASAQASGNKPAEQTAQPKSAEQSPKPEPSPSTRDVTPKQEAIPRENISQVFQEKISQLNLNTARREARDFILGPKDVIKITVWGNEDLLRQVTISEEGGFSYPFIGDISADGKTVAQLEKEITQRLSGRYIINPQVNINIESYKSKLVYVIGEVTGVRAATKEGIISTNSFPLVGQTTLFEMLGLAGGPTPTAGSEVLVLRPAAKGNITKPITPDQVKGNEIIRLNLWKLLAGDQSQNIYLEAGDTVYVPKAEFFFVYGEVKTPGKYNLEKGVNVLKGISMAGGATDKAALNRAKLVREKDGKKIEINKVKLDELIQPEDIIMVPESFF
ncbi:MAG: polysaccharide biosynthesis/export family protein [Candidatus Tectomicrobia bacterium]|uniref:Polysaccharide biosynthesis/export family protein n=1 Tax=Tectimicrobiota bacterium TaxID=2528274 RepID=A0A933GLU5_UNCTE|nr:polysaccharide biosynthesis/export family protein [Candidatus Tectomicrobia bacterium]